RVGGGGGGGGGGEGGGTGLGEVGEHELLQAHGTRFPAGRRRLHRPVAPDQQVGQGPDAVDVHHRQPFGHIPGSLRRAGQHAVPGQQVVHLPRHLHLPGGQQDQVVG